jgi:cell division protein ZapE|tara:strand:- start:2090 stop:3217 length:1128 start_codon:yes stop_codon:yes gene_type:complete
MHIILPSPKQRYLLDLQQDGFNYDPAQEVAVDLLQSLYGRLIEDELVRSKKGLFAKLCKQLAFPCDTGPIQGLYFWGGVGRGKTYLMDSFFDSLPFEMKMRVHFHRFMRRVHMDLKLLKGKKNPLDIVADNIADEARVICFDEFFVSDIADAMLLGKLFELLFARQVTLVATSNVEPDELYLNGLQRQRFLPAIELLKQNTSIINVDNGLDYRLRSLEQAELYHFPLGPAADRVLMEAFEVFCPLLSEVIVDGKLEVENRQIQCRRLGKEVVWFDFNVICNTPRSQNDYIELSRDFHAILVSNVPIMGKKNEDQARRFINLVDEFYDRSIKLVLSAEVSLMLLYEDGALNFEFRRTTSRLLEMQSYDYLARPHRP